MSTLSYSGCMPFSEIWRTDPGLEIHQSEALDGPCGGALADDFLVASDSLQANDLTITSG